MIGARGQAGAALAVAGPGATVAGLVRHEED